MKRFLSSRHLLSEHKWPLVAVAVSLVLYVCRFEIPLVLITWFLLATRLPLPRVFSSLVSRIFASLGILYGLLQIAAITQLYTYPAGKFPFIALLLTGMTAALILLFPHKNSHTHFFNLKDLGALIAVAAFIFPFSPIMLGNHSIDRIASIGGVQVVDSIVHFGSISTYTENQTLRVDYTPGRYYPSGFHIATAFIEHSFLGDTRKLTWKQQVVLYFSQYMIFGAVLTSAIVYFAYGLLERLRGMQSTKLEIMGIGIAIGASEPWLHTWLFVYDGFLNYMYIVAAVLLAACFALDEPIAYKETAKIKENLLTYTWPLTVFLVIGFGASCSWPLLAPVFLLTTVIYMWPLPTIIWRDAGRMRNYVVVCLPILGAALLNLMTVYMQSLYWKGNDKLLVMGGALQNFNIIFLLIGCVALVYVITKNSRGVATSLFATFLPYLLLITVIMGIHYFTLGEVRYYVIKVSLLIEILLMGVLAVAATYALQAVKIDRFIRTASLVIILPFVTFLTIGMLHQPLNEVRGLFRNQSGAGKPPFYDHDTAAVANLGSHNKLGNFNMTILHYDAAGDRLFAHIQPALWANAFSPFSADSVGDIAGSKQKSCFGGQYAALAYPQNTPAEQLLIREKVEACINDALATGQRYYIITDQSSVPKLHEFFGEKPVFVY